MKKTIRSSETIIGNLFSEVEIICSRINDIEKTYLHTLNSHLKTRLVTELINLSKRLEEINSISSLIKESSCEDLTISSILIEKCSRKLKYISLKSKLFFS